MKTPKNRVLQITGIVMIVGGIIGVIAGTIAFTSLGFLTIILDSEADFKLSLSSIILSVIISVINIVAGIVGVINSDRPENAGVCFIFGFITLISSVFASTLSMLGGKSYQISSLLIGLIIPILYLVGAYQNKQLTKVTLNSNTIS